ncbi:MAG: TlpA family protein disulfide reductase [Fimbriimonadaceae bacterium]
MTRIFESYPKKRVAVISGDSWNDDISGARKLSTKLGVPTVVGIRRIASKFRSRTVPFFVVVNRKGKVVFAESGFRGGQPIEDAVNQALVQR